jgi:hypothetical protein
MVKVFGINIENGQVGQMFDYHQPELNKPSNVENYLNKMVSYLIKHIVLY